MFFFTSLFWLKILVTIQLDVTFVTFVLIVTFVHWNVLVSNIPHYGCATVSSILFVGPVFFFSLADTSK